MEAACHFFNEQIMSIYFMHLSNHGSLAFSVMSCGVGSTWVHTQNTEHLFIREATCEWSIAYSLAGVAEGSHQTLELWFEHEPTSQAHALETWSPTGRTIGSHGNW